MTIDSTDDRPAVRRWHPAARWAGRTGHLVIVTVVVFILATLITFALGVVSGVSPSAVVAGDEATSAQVAQIEHQWGLDRPLIVQYADWLGGILHGDFGDSWRTSRPVFEQLVDKAPLSLSVALLAMAIGIVFGFALGLIAALTQGSIVDRAISALASAWTAIPAFAVGVVLISVFAVQLGWFPAGGYIPFEQDPGGWVKTVTLPAIALSLDTVGDLARQVRTGMVRAFDGNYVTGAVLNGYSRTRVVRVHVLRNGIGPGLAILGLKFPTVLGGAIVTEAVFSMAGYGVFTAKAASGGDLPVVQGALIVSIVLVLIFNTVVNLLLNKFSPDRRAAI